MKRLPQFCHFFLMSFFGLIHFFREGFDATLKGSYFFLCNLSLLQMALKLCILARVRAVNRSEVIQAQSRVDVEARKLHVKELGREASKAEAELERLQSEIIKSLTGESVFTPEMLKPAIDAQERKYADLMTTLREAEAEMYDSENNLLALSEKFDDFLEWAVMYDEADIAAKKMIISRIIDRVDMHTGYDIKITLNISIEQFLNTIEMVA